MSNGSKTPQVPFHPKGIGDRIWHYAVWWPMLRPFARDDLSLYRRLRGVITIALITACSLVLLARCGVIGADMRPDWSRR